MAGRRARRRESEWLIGAVVLAALLDFGANWLAAHAMVIFGPFVVPAGTFLFALGFTTYDYIRRQHGLRPTIVAVGLGFLISILYATAWGGGVGRIALAGLVALVFSSTTDVLVQTWMLRRPLWQYVAVANCASLLVDSAVFVTIAFAAVPFDGRLHILAGQYLVKVLMTVVSIPLVYGARAWASGPRRARVALA